MKLQAYLAIALLHPKEQMEIHDKNSEEENTEIILKPELVLAANQDQAKVKAGRLLPEDIANKLMHRVEVIIRPF